MRKRMHQKSIIAVF